MGRVLTTHDARISGDNRWHSLVAHLAR